jgi:hypothetical protein
MCGLICRVKLVIFLFTNWWLIFEFFVKDKVGIVVVPKIIPVGNEHE